MTGNNDDLSNTTAAQARAALSELAKGGFSDTVTYSAKEFCELLGLPYDAAQMRDQIAAYEAQKAEEKKDSDD